MSDSLYYNFESNNASLDDIGSHMNGINEAKGHIAKVFNMLGEVYTGDAADQLQFHHGNIQSKLDTHMQDRLQTHVQAGHQQEAMQALDRAQAGQF